jgi:hypothetical protein
MVSSMRRSLCATAALAWTLGVTATPAQSPDTSLKAVLAGADAYLAEYTRQLTFLLADETYAQQVADSSGARHRTMHGELFVTFVPEERMWLAVRDVADVDGAPVPDRDDLRELLARNPIGRVARPLIDRNARFNLGSIVRNFNEPTLALRVLDPDRRAQMKLDRRRVTQTGPATVVTIAFRETGRATLVRGIDGRDVPSSGELEIDAGTGRIHRTSIEFTFERITARLETTYAPVPRLGLWLPSVFTERYERGARRGGARELVECEARYTNWRKFDVNVRIR